MRLSVYTGGLSWNGNRRVCCKTQAACAAGGSLVDMMNMTTITAAIVLASAVSLGAQSSETTTKTTIDVKDGKNVKVTGCVEAGLEGGYILTNVADKTGDRHQYALVSEHEDFSKVIHDRVEIEGTIADSRDGKVEIKTETKVDGPARDTHSKVEGKGAYLGVKHMKMIATSCP
jgi:hypothetical protein